MKKSNFTLAEIKEMVGKKYTPTKALTVLEHVMSKNWVKNSYRVVDNGKYIEGMCLQGGIEAVNGPAQGMIQTALNLAIGRGVPWIDNTDLSQNYSAQEALDWVINDFGRGKRGDDSYIVSYNDEDQRRRASILSKIRIARTRFIPKLENLADFAALADAARNAFDSDDIPDAPEQLMSDDSVEETSLILKESEKYTAAVAEYLEKNKKAEDTMHDFVKYFNEIFDTDIKLP